MLSSTEPQPGHQHHRPPHGDTESLSTRRAKRELELGHRGNIAFDGLVIWHSKEKSSESALKH